MLVLSRKSNEQIVILTPSGEVVSVMVIEIRGDKARLGFDAARDVQIHRKEVFEQLHGPLSGRLAAHRIRKQKEAHSDETLHVQPQHDPQPPDPA